MLFGASFSRLLVSVGRSLPNNERIYPYPYLVTCNVEMILSLTRELGVNLAGVEIILNMRRKIEEMQTEVNEFVAYVKQELTRGLGDWEQRLGTAIVKSSPTDLILAGSEESKKKQESQESSSNRDQS